MYLGYFGFETQPFSIVPDHRAMYMSESHREAVAHLLYAMNESGVFVQLTGEVGTGKTTVSRYILANLPDDVDAALLLNPRITEKEMLEGICDELSIEYPKSASQRDLNNHLNDYLLDAHARGRKTVLVVDEAQTLSREVLEQIRLLTNLETSSEKLLQIILIGQPELASTLRRHDLRQLAQRIVGRFNLEPLNKIETREYIEHRLSISGVQHQLFTPQAISLIHKLSGGIPRLINILCDRALLGAYASSKYKVDGKIVDQAASEVLNEHPRKPVADWINWKWASAVAVTVFTVFVISQNALNFLSMSATDESAEVRAKIEQDYGEGNPPLAARIVVPGSEKRQIANSGCGDCDLMYRPGLGLDNGKP